MEPTKPKRFKYPEMEDMIQDLIDNDFDVFRQGDTLPMEEHLRHGFKGYENMSEKLVRRLWRSFCSRE